MSFLERMLDQIKADLAASPAPTTPHMADGCDCPICSIEKTERPVTGFERKVAMMAHHLWVTIGLQCASLAEVYQLINRFELIENEIRTAGLAADFAARWLEIARRPLARPPAPRMDGED